MAGEKKQMTQEEILSQLPDELKQRRFSTAPVDGYDSVWEPEESLAQLAWRKFKQNPFIPLGLGGTVYFLTRGVLNMGNSRLTQKMMRGRVLAQGFTLTALVVGFAIEGLKEERKQRQNQVTED